MTIDQIGYALKGRFPSFFKVIEFLAGYATALRHRRSIHKALQEAQIEGRVLGKPALIRVLEPADLKELTAFFAALPEERMTYFRPHGFSQRDLRQVLDRPYFIAYGLFVDGQLQGYSLFKLYPGKKVFFGRILPKNLSGCGLGKILSLYLQWQSGLLGFRMRGTINLQNLPSVGSHKAVGGFEQLGELPNGYTLIEFPPARYPREAPKLEAVQKAPPAESASGQN